MAAGSIIVDLLMRTGSFETDTERARKSLAKFEKQAVQTGKVIGTALAVGAVAAAALFQSLTTGAAEFKDLEETTGASAENIAGFAVAAATAGVQVESVAGSMQKLTKNLVGVDDEGKAAGAALQALGLNVEDFKRLDPASQYEAIGKALAGFADGAEKTAVAQALFGKSGAEQLKVFKALEEAGGRQTILTQRQIELADAYADAQAKSAAQLRLYAQAAATQAIPALTDLTSVIAQVAREVVGIDSATGELAENNGVKRFAEAAADALAIAADQVDAFVRTFQIAGRGIAGYAAIVGALSRGNLAEARAAGKAAEEDISRVIDRISFADRLSKQREQSINARLGQDPRELARRGRGAAELPRLQFEGAAKPPARAQREAVNEAEQYTAALQRQLAGVFDLTAAEQVLYDLRTGKVGAFSVEEANRAKAIADEIDATKEAIRVARERADFKNRDYEAANEAAAANAIAERTRLTALLSGTEQAMFDRRQSDLVVLQNALEKGAIDAEQYADAVRNLFDIADDGGKDAKRAVDELGMSFRSAFEDAVVEGKRFGDVLRGLEQDLIRIALRKLVIEPAANSLASSLGSFFAGGNQGTGFYNQGQFVGPPQLAVGMDYVPYDGFVASLHKGERVQTAADAGFERRNGSGWGGRVVIENHGSPVSDAGTTIDADGAMRIKLLVADDIARGGPVASAMKRKGLRLDGALPNRTR